MKSTCYLAVSRQGVQRMTKGPPGLYEGEISIGVKIDVPDDLFVRPRISASINVSKDAVPPIEIDAGMLEAISENIRAGLGVEVALEIVEPEEKPETT